MERPEIEPEKPPLPYENPHLSALSTFTSRVGILGRVSWCHRIFNVGIASAAVVHFDDFPEFELEIEQAVSYRRERKQGAKT